MDHGDDLRVSPALQAALAEFHDILEADDFARSQMLAVSDTDRLEALTAAVEPLYGEINHVLDDLVRMPHPLPGDLEDLEVNLNSLAQAAMEAEQTLRARSER